MHYPGSRSPENLTLGDGGREGGVPCFEGWAPPPGQMDKGDSRCCTVQYVHERPAPAMILLFMPFSSRVSFPFSYTRG